MHLMLILWWGVMCSNTTYKNLICRYKHVSERSFKRVYITKFFNPIQPFLEYICRNRRRIEDSRNSWHFPSLIGKIVESSRDMEETTQFVLSSSIALTCTDCPTFFETDNLTVTLLEDIRSARRQIGYCRPADRWRPLQILAKLRDDGLSDVVIANLSFSERSALSQSLVSLVRDNYTFTDALINKAVGFLMDLRPTSLSTIPSNRIITELVPSSDGSLSDIEHSLRDIKTSLSQWNNEGPEVIQSGKRMIQALISEGFADTLEQMLMNNMDGVFGIVVVLVLGMADRH
ncbi:hypothetical protein BLNAU_6167 [Blattamonas nauphoetae]|uniref:Uncharacterized protein n=1 Tax=Blattamonas nauphoetae TaxID=2049346 RepID=A0ABQ9Y597_9EUKA|nr:hypothetical protein BLNAU_6167 [Blattamonas nauphoetae]